MGSLPSRRRFPLDRLFDSPNTDLDSHHELKGSPIFTETVRKSVESLDINADAPVFPQYGVIAANQSHSSSLDSEQLLHYNVSAPSSAFICGSQGSGKSHTLSCLLENCLLQSDANELPRPLSGIVFHYDTFGSDSAGSPCEAAFLSNIPGISVRILCAPTSVATIRKTYSSLPRITVEELRINESDLNTRRMMDMMAVKEGGTMPLYLHVVSRILRDLRLDQQKTGSKFKYNAFKTMLDDEPLTVEQRRPLTQRLDTLESFMVPMQTKPVSQKGLYQQATGNDWTPRQSQLTIVDLTCPCVTPESACSLFNICLSLFLEQNKNSVGRIVALDEAHKYMNESAEAGTLTDQLLSTIRMQRHLGMRVVIATQEPTVSPKLLDLCSVTIVHRFTSPGWFAVLRKHLAGLNTVARVMEEVAGGDSDNDENGDGKPGGYEGVKAMCFDVAGRDAATDIFAQVVRLRVGEALLFAPSAVLGVAEDFRPKKLNHGVLKIRVRKRLTADGGKSIMAE